MFIEFFSKIKADVLVMLGFEYRDFQRKIDIFWTIWTLWMTLWGRKMGLSQQKDSFKQFCRLET